MSKKDSQLTLLVKPLEHFFQNGLQMNHICTNRTSAFVHVAMTSISVLFTEGAQEQC